MSRVIPNCRKTGSGSGGGGDDLLVQDESIDVEAATTTINFFGAGVTATSGGAGIVDVEIPGGAGGNDSLLLFGSGTVGGSTTTRYLYPGYDDGLAQTAVIQINAAYAGTLQDFYIRHNSPGGSGADITYTIRINSVASIITATLASTGTAVSDLVNTAAVVAGDLIDVEITKAGGVGAGPSDIACTINLKVA